MSTTTSNTPDAVVIVNMSGEQKSVSRDNLIHPASMEDITVDSSNDSTTTKANYFNNGNQQLTLEKSPGANNNGSLIHHTNEHQISSTTDDVFTDVDINEGLTKGPKVITVRPAVDDEPSSRGWFCCGNDKRRLDRILKRKQEERAADFARLQSQYKLEGENKRITSLGWEELVEELQTKKLTATAVLEAYIAKALADTTKFNSVTEFIPQAFALAKELDSLESPKGPLHGIPFCVKDDHNVEGMDTSHGFAHRLYKPADESSITVQTLIDLGAVPFCKTNIPQTMFTYGSDNPVYGTTCNATNVKLSPGGSSSGTGSLVGSSGAMFGTGSDIGGSLRIPAHFNGVATIKPTSGRLSMEGIPSSLPNLMGLSPVCGIIGQTPTVVSTVFKSMVEDLRQYKKDPKVLPIPWNHEAFTSKKKLKIGYFTSMPFFPAMGDTEEVTLRAKSTLESLGHTLVEFNMPDGYDYMKTISRFLLADQNRHFRKCLKGEKVAQSIFLMNTTSYVPVSIQRFLARLMNSKFFPFMYTPRTSVMVGAGATSTHELWDAQGHKMKTTDELFAEWKRLDIDALICPLFPFAAPLIDLPGILPQAVVYSIIWNLVDFPAGVVPFGRESGKNIQSFDDEGDVVLRMVKKNMKESIGAPIGVQVVGLPHDEETVLRLMMDLEKFSYKNK